MNVWPAIVNVPVRGEAVVLGATLKVTPPSPLPLAGLVKVIHAVPDEAVHAQPAPAVTFADPLPPEAGTDWLVGLIAYVQGAPA